MYTGEHSNEKLKNNIVGSEWWLNSENLSFPEILVQSRVPDKWARYDKIEDMYHESLLRPVNRYVSNLYPRPEIKYIDKNKIIFRQRTHAEIWVEDYGNALYALDKTHQRQFYPSKNQHSFSNCYPATYRFYVPWFINKECSAFINPVTDEETPFICIKKELEFSEVSLNTKYVDIDFVDFGIKREGSWMLDGSTGILPRLSAMYDMVIYLNESDLDLIRGEYDLE